MTSFYAQDLVDVSTLSKHLAALIGQSEDLHWAVLVDTAFDHASRPLPVSRGINCFTVADDSGLEELADIAPCLYPMESKSDAAQRDLLPILEHCNGRPMWSLLAARLNAKELAHRWAATWRADVGDGQTMLLRFADSRVLPTLPTILDRQWPAIAGPVLHWYYPDRFGRLAQLPGMIGEASGQPRVKLNSDQLDALIRAAEADGHLVNLASDNGGYKDASSAAALHARVEAACTLADQHAIDNQADRQTLALLATLIQAPLNENAELNGLLASKTWVRGQLAAQITLSEPGISGNHGALP